LGVLLAVATAGAVTASISSAAVVNPTSSGSFGLKDKVGLFGIQNISNGHVVTSVPRGGATSTTSDDDDNVDEEEKPQILYLPGLLDAIVAKKTVTTDAQTDSTITISPKKAKELKVANGDIVAIVGRRRRASYGIVAVTKMSTSKASISYNMASNLRLRENEKLKIVPIQEGAEEQEERSGDMILLAKKPDVVASVTFAPVEDSYNTLVASEGGDDIEDEELKERFVDNYLNMDAGGDIVIKEGNIVSIRDENGKTLEFIISHVGGEEDDEMAEEGMSTYCILSSIMHSVELKLNNNQ